MARVCTPWREATSAKATTIVYTIFIAPVSAAVYSRDAYAPRSDMRSIISTPLKRLCAERRPVEIAGRVGHDGGKVGG